MGLNVAGECGLKGGGEESRLLSEGGICEVSEYVRPASLGDNNGRKVSPGSAKEYRWATIMGESVARECLGVPLGNDNGRKCRPGVPRSTVGQR